MKNSKKILLITLLSLCIFTNNIYAAENQNIKVFYNNDEIIMNPPANIIDNRTLVPLRAFLEYFNITVEWNQDQQLVTAYNNTTNISLFLGSKGANVNNGYKALDVPAQLIENRIFIPLRFFSEEFNLNVNWNQDTKSIFLTDKDINNPLKSTISTTENNLFKLSDEQILEAIEEGANGFKYVNNIFLTKYSLTPSIQSAYDIFVGQISISTPYMLIMQQSAIKTANYESMTLEEGRIIVDSFSKAKPISLSVIYYPTDSSNKQIVNFIIKQNGNIFKPQKIDGINNIPRITNTFPDFPEYELNLYPSFNTNEYATKIDFTKPMELIVIHAPEMESKYNIDFSYIK